MNLYSILKIIVKNKSYNPVYDMNDLKQKNCSGKIQELNYPCFVSMNIWTPILHLQNNLQFSWKYSKAYVKLWTLKCLREFVNVFGHVALRFFLHALHICRIYTP